MADFSSDDKPRPHREVVIEDLRHRRNVEEDGAEEAPPEPRHEPAAKVETPPAAKTPVAEQAPAGVAEDATAAQGSTQPAQSADAARGHAEEPAGALPEAFDEEAEHAANEDELRAMQREELRQIIELGLVNYLRYQLTMILNFALLNLGSAADPGTGLISKNLPHAKLAIDVMEFLISRVAGEMQPAERQQMAALLSDLKYAYLQAVSEVAPVPGSGAPGGTQGEA